MRTTIRLPDDLLAAAKRHAVDRGITLTRVIEEALRVALARQEAEETPMEEVSLPICGSGGLRRGVDLDDSAALLDLMEGGDG